MFTPGKCYPSKLEILRQIRQKAARKAKGSSNEYQTMIRLSEGWPTCKAQHEFNVNAVVFLEKRHLGFACIHLPISDTGLKRQTLLLLHVDNL